MDIRKIEMYDLFAGGFCCPMEGVFHQKSLSCFSIVQSVSGSYDVSLGAVGPFSTGALGVFVAPPGIQQTILHHNNAGGVMKVHWLFFNATLNGRYPLESVYQFPALLPAEYGKTARDLLEHAANSLCGRYAAAYALLDILLHCASPLPQEDPVKLQLQNFVRENYAGKIKAEQLAFQLHCSVPQVYRYTRKYFQCSPANYVNRVRLENAARLLEITAGSVKEIAYACGFEDLSYFSRLFRNQYGISPQQYRARLIPMAASQE